MQRTLFFLTFSLLISLCPVPADAQSASVMRRLRFEQLVQAVDGTDGMITEDQIAAFLRSRAKERLNQLPVEERSHLLNGKTEEVFLDEFADAQTVRKVINNADHNRNHAIDFESEPPLTDNFEIVDFENARLDPPLPPLMKDLLPPSVMMPAPPLPPADKSLLQRLDDVISVRQSFLDERGIGRPATFTWTEFGKSDETLGEGRDRSKFEIQGAVTFEPVFFPPLEGRSLSFAWNPVGVFEIDSSSDAKDKRNSLIHRIGMQSVLYRSLRTGHNFDLTFDYTTDRDYRSELVGWTFQYSPNAFDLGIGQYLPRPTRDRPASPIQFRWRPFLGLVAADVRDPGESEDLRNMKDFSNAFARISIEIMLGSRVKITPEGQLVRELENDDEDHTAYSIGVQWLFDQQERVSLLIFYEQGERAPLFKNKDVTKIALGLKL